MGEVGKQNSAPLTMAQKSGTHAAFLSMKHLRALLVVSFSNDDSNGHENGTKQ